MNILLRKKALAWIFLRQINTIAQDDFSICSLNIKSFYHGLMLVRFFSPIFRSLIFQTLTQILFKMEQKSKAKKLCEKHVAKLLLCLTAFAWKANRVAFAGFVNLRGKKYFTGHQIAKTIPLFVLGKKFFLVYFFFWKSRSEGEFPRDQLINVATCLFAFH